MPRRILGALVAVALAGASALAGAVPAIAAETPIIIWADATRAPLIEARTAKGVQGHPVQVVTKDANAIRDELKTVGPEDAPDIIWAPNEWTGELASDGLVVKIPLAAKLRSQFPPAVLDGYKFGFAYYGLPVQYENVALITNATLVPEPVKTFAELNKKATALKKKGLIDVGIAVAQGSAGNAYFMNPLFTGLGGYVFGTNAAGSLDPTNIGIDNPDFRKQMARIDRWNASGLIDSALDVKSAETAFTSGRAPFWITGPWSTQTLGSLTFKYFLSPVPQIVAGQVPAPYLGVKGFMVTKFAEEHGVLEPALSLVRRQFSQAAWQGKVAAATGRAPASTTAPAGRLAKAFAVAGARGIPTLNIPQAQSTWGPLGRAWADATRGAGATPAAEAFARAQQEVEAAVG